MLNIVDTKLTRFCDGISRRNFLRVGSLGLAGLNLPDLLRWKAQAASSSSPPLDGEDRLRGNKSIIMVYLFGGPSHLDRYDLKPEAPAEYRGEFKPISTNVPGTQICELMPLQAKIADKLAIVRNMDFTHPLGNAHAPPFLYGAPIANR